LNIFTCLTWIGNCKLISPGNQLDTERTARMDLRIAPALVASGTNRAYHSLSQAHDRAPALEGDR
jgi:hypothetical protein